MYSLLALTVTALTACVFAHPPDVREVSDDRFRNEALPTGFQLLEPPNRKSIRDYLLPRYLLPRSQYVANDERTRIPYPRPQMPASDWLNEEIDRINRMQYRAAELVPYKSDLPRWLTHEPYKRIFGPVGSYGTLSHLSPYNEYSQLLPSEALMAAGAIPRKRVKALHKTSETTTKEQEIHEVETQEDSKIFALTPRDQGYFDPSEKDNSLHNPLAALAEGPQEGGGHEESAELARRQIRQNPINSRNLVAEDLYKLRNAVSKQQMRIPVSLIPTNLKWLKITNALEIVNGSDNADSKDQPQHTRVLGSEFATSPIYAVGIAAGVGTGIVLAIVGFAFGWYALSKRAKAAADVDYPAYGVTGPTMDTSGDRKLAHSAQMYHYQHQKQQIIAMERNHVEKRNGSVSDPESEEENEEGDYTVYECPGFATTGDMEVKNPLFNEDPTPATPGNVEVVKPQPKE